MLGEPLLKSSPGFYSSADSSVPPWKVLPKCLMPHKTKIVQTCMEWLHQQIWGGGNKRDFFWEGQKNWSNFNTFSLFWGETEGQENIWEGANAPPVVPHCMYSILYTSCTKYSIVIHWSMTKSGSNQINSAIACSSVYHNIIISCEGNTVVSHFGHFAGDAGLCSKFFCFILLLWVYFFPKNGIQFQT